jgi:hypothetical protein
MTLSDSRPVRRLRDVEAAPNRTGLPRLPAVSFQRAVPITPADQNGCLCRLLPHPMQPSPFGSRVGVHDFAFRGLLRLHACYGPLDRSTAQDGLCHEASTEPVTRLHRSSATRPNRQLPGWNLPPLTLRAFGAHCQTAECSPSTVAPKGPWTVATGELRGWANARPCGETRGEKVAKRCPGRGRGEPLHASSAPLGRDFGSDASTGSAALTRGYSPQPLRGLAGLAAVEETGFDAGQGFCGLV